MKILTNKKYNSLINEIEMLKKEVNKSVDQEEINDSEKKQEKEEQLKALKKLMGYSENQAIRNKKEKE